MIETKNNPNFDLSKKKIAVFGLGVSGLSALRFLTLFKAKLYAINSGDPAIWSKQPGVLEYVDLNHCYSEPMALEAKIFDEVDLVILSPGISREHSLLSSAHQRKIPIWGEIELAYRYLEASGQLSYLIGITGTNGKTTTTTFLGEMIATDNKKVFVGGNIGVPFCDYAYDVYHHSQLADFILLELSSFQLESIDHFHLNCAALLNIFQNHGERYTTLTEYAQAKFLITNNFKDNDLLIYPSGFPLIANWAESQKGIKKIINISSPVISYSVDNFKLPGLHNLINLAFVVSIAEQINISSAAIKSTIANFHGVHHRVEPIIPDERFHQLKFFNDAKSTNWDATVTAVKAMEGFSGPLFLIIGGKKRGHGDSIAPHLTFFKDKVTEFLLIGDMADEIATELEGVFEFKKVFTLDKAIEYVQQKNIKKGTVLFSPAFPSFDQYRNYAHRGEHFVELLTKKS